MLDPRFKGLKFLSCEDCDSVVSHLKDDVNPASGQAESEQPAAKRLKGEKE